MDEQQLLALKPELDRFLDRFAPLFGPDGNQAHARRFVQGLLRGGERRNAENIAEAMSGGPVRSLQAFITTGVWPDREILTELRRFVVEILGDDDAVWNSDETGFPKKGAKSVGVKRQYSGTLGRTDNCQVAVFANYSSAKGHTFMDRRLFLPEEWASDPGRREEAGVPAGVIFRTKPELALEMVAGAVSERIPFRWVGGDSIYGNSPTFVQGVRQLGKWYVLDISSEAHVWTKQPQVIPPEQRPKQGRGRSHTRSLVIGESEQVDQVVAALPASAWHRVTVAEGSQGPLIYEYAEVGVWFSEEGLPGSRERLLVRRSLGQEPELKYHRSNAPPEVPLNKVTQVRATRWTIEEDIKSAKGQCGLDEYETRGWIGWHHHTTLSLLALAFLVLQRVRVGGKRATAECSRSAQPFWSTCWKYARGTWTRSYGGPIGVGSAIVKRPQATASDVAPSCGAAACEVGPGSLRCSIRLWAEQSSRELEAVGPRLGGSRMIDHGERKLVILLSMHRCGSSLTTNILHRLGMSLGPFELNCANFSNPHGHYEAVPILNLNRRIQNLAYGFTEDLPDEPATLARFCATKGEWADAIDIPEDLFTEGQSLIRTLIDSGGISGFKDPRTVLTWPFWTRVLADFPDVSIVPLSLLRSPHEIAMSLVNRSHGWRGYWTSLDVTAVHLHRQKLILESANHRPPSLCFGSPTYLKTLEIAAMACGLTWDPVAVLDLFDHSCVHQSPAVVRHEAQDLFECLNGGGPAHLDLDMNQSQLERDARILENLRLQQWHSRDDEIREAREAARQAARDEAPQAAQEEAPQAAQEEARQAAQEEARQAALRADQLETQLRETRCRLAESERTRIELQSQIIDTNNLLNQVQERELQALHRNEQLRDRLERFDSHPILGPAIRGRRRIRRLIHLNATGPGSNDGESHRRDAGH